MAKLFPDPAQILPCPGDPAYQLGGLLLERRHRDEVGARRRIGYRPGLERLRSPRRRTPLEDTTISSTEYLPGARSGPLGESSQGG